jgi:hypothetical protein
MDGFLEFINVVTRIQNEIEVISRNISMKAGKI